MTSLIIGAAIALAVPMAAVAANAVIHWPRTQPQTNGPRTIPAKLTVRGLIDEAFATLFAFLGPFATLAPAPRPAATRPAKVVILHEPIRAAASWLLVRRLRKSGWSVATITVTARLRENEDLDRIGQGVLAKIDGDGPITVIGLGAAGLLARELAARHPRFTRVVTVATPHQGTFSRAFPNKLRPPSAYVARVLEIDREPRPFDSIALYSDGDAWIEPTTAAYYPGAFNLEVHDLGHLSMLFSRRVFGYIEENLAAPMPPEQS